MGSRALIRQGPSARVGRECGHSIAWSERWLAKPSTRVQIPLPACFHLVCDNVSEPPQGGKQWSHELKSQQPKLRPKYLPSSSLQSIEMLKPSQRPKC